MARIKNLTYFIGIDSRGRKVEIILVPDDVDGDLWRAIHARADSPPKDDPNHDAQAESHRVDPRRGWCRCGPRASSMRQKPKISKEE